jgi:hypothetical protein
MNIMLVSVKERTREIGVRKAVGARRQDITFQFLFEAMTLTTVGGIIGILFAILVSYIVIFFLPSLPAQIPLWAVVNGLFRLADGGPRVWRMASRQSLQARPDRVPALRVKRGRAVAPAVSAGVGSEPQTEAFLPECAGAKPPMHLIAPGHPSDALRWKPLRLRLCLGACACNPRFSNSSAATAPAGERRV